MHPKPDFSRIDGRTKFWDSTSQAPQPSIAKEIQSIRFCVFLKLTKTSATLSIKY